jgi:N-acetylmuramoyl-L-alanine amidase
MAGRETRDLPLNARPLPLFFTAIALGVFVLARSLASQAPPAPVLTVMARDGRRTIALASIGDQEFVGLDDLAAAFQLAVREEAGAITITYKGKTIIVTPDQALASVSGRLVSLPAPPSHAGRRWLVPVEFISRALAPVYDVKLDLRKASHLLVVGDLRVPRLTARYEAVGGGARLTIDAVPHATSTVQQDGERLTIKFDADALDAPNPLVPQQPAPAIVQDARIVGPATVQVDLGPRFAAFRAAAQPADAATRLVIDFVPPATTTPETPAVPPPAAPAPATELPPAFSQPTSAIRTVAIDAGHGGDDEGVKGPGGTKEKDVTLAVARRLKGAIEGRLGIRALLTRDDDRAVGVDDRTALANNNKADLFISLHASASWRPTTAGAMIFSAAFPHDAEQQARASLAPEPLPTFGGGVRDIELVPWDLAQFRHLDHSVAYATMLEQLLHDKVPMGSHPVDQAPLRILESANMPAVLVEMGFLTNPAQEKALAGPDFQGVFVQAVFDSVVKFRDYLGAAGAK